MSQRTLQRVLVRLLYDPAFAGRVFADPDRALAGLTLSASERAWLASADPRPFRLDPLRRTRTLRALLDEYPATLALALRPEGPDLDAFFSSDAFHAAIQERRALAPIFGGWLAAVAGPPTATGALARLEAAMSALRRAAQPRARPGALALSAHAALCTLPGGTSALYSSLRERIDALGTDPVAALYAEPLARLAVPALDAAAEETLLLERHPDGSVDVSELSEALAELLALARHGAPREALEAAVRRHGAESPEDAEIIDDLLAEGLLVAAADAPGDQSA